MNLGSSALCSSVSALSSLVPDFLPLKRLLFILVVTHPTVAFIVLAAILHPT